VTVSLLSNLLRYLVTIQRI